MTLPRGNMINGDWFEPDYSTWDIDSLIEEKNEIAQELEDMLIIAETSPIYEGNDDIQTKRDQLKEVWKELKLRDYKDDR
jgi:hypothetical protein